MSIIQGSAHTSTGGYQIERSLRFNSADSAYLNRTLGTSNRRTFTFSAWVKRSLLASTQCIFGNINFAGGGSTNQQFFLGFNGSDQLDLLHYNNGTSNGLTSSAVYRDPSAFYHVVCAIDTTQATSSNRLKLYINGSQITAFASSSYPTQNTDTFINANLATAIGTQVGTGIGNSYYIGGYLTEVNFIDGQALTPSSFGETDSNTGVWKPKAFSGTYGTNGFYLKFADNSGTTSTTLGKDSSGNGNNWTPNNFSVTAGAGNDSLVDTPTNYGTDTGAGGEVRGNYCTWNGALPAAVAGPSIATISNGNLDVALLSNVVGDLFLYSTTLLSSGKWYYEFTISATTNNGHGIGASGVSFSQLSGNSYAIYRWQSGVVFVNTGNVTTGLPTCTTNDVIGVAIDVGAGTIQWFKNNTSLYTATGLTYSTYIPLIYGDAGTGRTFSGTTNFGQRPFAYTAPSGFKALCTQNLPTPAVVQGDDYFNTVLYTGTGSAQSITGVGFQPDFLWVKPRNNANAHHLIDAVRGIKKHLFSNLTNTEETANAGTGFTSFDSNGFSLGTDTSTTGNTNLSTVTYAAWNWKANGAGSSNTAGSISSTVSASTTAGFSVVTYTGTGANATVGHGLGVAPSMIIIKGRSTAYDWRVYHTSVGNTSAVFLNTTAASAASSTYWNNTSPTSTVFSLGTNAGMNESAGTYVAYCFAPVAGYSAFGSYTGNGNADGPFIYTGFRPRWVMHKRTDTGGTNQDWRIWDTARSPSNLSRIILLANTSNADIDDAAVGIDIVSNGFKLRNSDANVNTNGGTFIYAAFAEHPFKHSLAR